jgi:hypothetical protein
MAAASIPYQFEPELSLTGDCTTATIDPIPDPSCPYAPSPAGPTGRFDDPRSVQTDAYGDVYVASASEQGGHGRIDVFDDEGHFLTEISEPAIPKSIAIDNAGDLYVTQGNTDEVVRYTPLVYEPESDNIQYGAATQVVSSVGVIDGGLAIDRADGHLFVTSSAGGESIKEYGSAAEGNPLITTIESPKLSWSWWPAVDAARGRIFVSYCKHESFECGILVLEADAPHAVVKEIDGSETAVGRFLTIKGWLSVAVDEETGHFFVEDQENENLYEFDQNFKLVSTLHFAGISGGNAKQIGLANTPLRPAARDRGYLFVPVLPSGNRALAFKPPAVSPPEVTELSASSISESEALLQGTVDPNGADAGWTVEYVAQAQFEATGFDGAQVGGAGTVPGAALPRHISLQVSGLAPGTAYRFRFRAENEAGSGGSDASFSTYADAHDDGTCENQALRLGDSARLPDCRAYELVTPADTNGHTINGISLAGDFFNTVLSTPGGDAVSFLIRGGALPGFEGNGGFNGDPYLAQRSDSGWIPQPVGPTGAEATASHPGSSSPDQGYRFWDSAVAGTALVEGREATYVRYPDGHSELIGRGSLGTDQSAQGKFIAEDGSHIVFETKSIGTVVARQLEPDAPPTGTDAVYDRTSDGLTHVVSLLPGNITPAAGESASYVATSSDGEGVAFSIGGTLYVRVRDAATFEIGQDLQLVGISAGGARVFYVKEGNLLAYDTRTEEVIPFADSGDVTAVNVAPDGSRAYFVSPSVLTGESNPNGATAVLGGQNLYVSEPGSLHFVATVTGRDVEGEIENSLPVDGLGLLAQAVKMGQLSREASRVTADGGVLVFQSRANLDGSNPEGLPQIYRYDLTAASLRCVSCNPTDRGEGGRASFQTFSEVNFDVPLGPYGFVPSLSTDGRRIFFESTEALVSQDTDGVRDVYEWEEAGTGSCTRPGGCVYLISSGHSERANYLYAQSASGDDVFFVSGDTLAGGGAGGAPAIYDARVGGGFPGTVESPCSGEGCKPGLTPAPPMLAAQSGSSSRSGNVKPTRHCPAGKRKVRHKGKAKCVRKHTKHRKHQKHRRRTGGKGKGAGR